jgi:hypothetical protein
MFLDRETYERAGLVGKPYGAKGDRARKPRWGTHTIFLVSVMIAAISNGSL